MTGGITHRSTHTLCTHVAVVPELCACGVERYWGRGEARCQGRGRPLKAWSYGSLKTHTTYLVGLVGLGGHGRSRLELAPLSCVGSTGCGDESESQGSLGAASLPPTCSVGGPSKHMKKHLHSFPRGRLHRQGRTPCHAHTLCSPPAPTVPLTPHKHATRPPTQTFRGQHTPHTHAPQAQGVRALTSEPRSAKVSAAAAEPRRAARARVPAAKSFMDVGGCWSGVWFGVAGAGAVGVRVFGVRVGVGVGDGELHAHGLRPTERTKVSRSALIESLDPLRVPVGSCMRLS